MSKTEMVRFVTALALPAVLLVATASRATTVSLFADDATLTAGGKTYSGKDQIRAYWQAAGPFRPENQWVAYTPAFRIRYAVDGKNARLYFECLYVDKRAIQIAAHTNSEDTLVRSNGKWLIKTMKASSVPEP